VDIGEQKPVRIIPEPVKTPEPAPVEPAKEPVPA
jgi:hypothetical protein